MAPSARILGLCIGRSGGCLVKVVRTKGGTKVAHPPIHLVMSRSGKQKTRVGTHQPEIPDLTDSHLSSKGCSLGGLHGGASCHDSRASKWCVPDSGYSWDRCNYRLMKATLPKATAPNRRRIGVTSSAVSHQAKCSRCYTVLRTLEKGTRLSTQHRPVHIADVYHAVWAPSWSVTSLHPRSLL
jgi:hypothetical protein